MISQSKEFACTSNFGQRTERFEVFFALFVIKKSIKTIKKKKIDINFSAIHQEKELFSIALQRLYKSQP